MFRCDGLHIHLSIDSFKFQGSNISNVRSFFWPEHMHEEGGDVHGNIYDSDSYEVNSDEDGDGIVVFNSEVNADYLDHTDDGNINGGGDSSYDDAEEPTNQSNNYQEEIDPSRL